MWVRASHARGRANTAAVRRRLETWPSRYFNAGKYMVAACLIAACSTGR